jgi:hypothetical protein
MMGWNADEGEYRHGRTSGRFSRVTNAPAAIAVDHGRPAKKIRLSDAAEAIVQIQSCRGYRFIAETV